MKSYPIIITILLLLNFAAKAQSSNGSNVLFDQIARGIKGDFSRLHDTISYLGFSIKIKIQKQNRQTKVISVTVKDSLGKVFLDDYSFLRSLNFIALLETEAESTIIIPVMLLRFSSTEAALLTRLYKRGVNKHIYKLFDFEPGEKGFSYRKYFTKPMLVYEDKTIYN